VKTKTVFGAVAALAAALLLYLWYKKQLDKARIGGITDAQTQILGF
jgi:hypothetical protein